jgi:hypothetical protein
MANAVYPLYKQSVLSADSNLSLNVNTTTDGPYIALIAATYTYSAAHQFYSSAVAAAVGTDQRIATPTVVTGTFDGDDVTFTSVTGSQVTQLVYYRHNSGANTTWRLFLFEDTSVTGLPVTPNGGNIVVAFNASGIFTISDLSLKENLVPVGELHGELTVYEYNYIGHPQRYRGLIAQDVERVVPEAVIDFTFPAQEGPPKKAVNYQMVEVALGISALRTATSLRPTTPYHQ